MGIDVFDGIVEGWFGVCGFGVEEVVYGCGGVMWCLKMCDRKICWCSMGICELV